MKSEWLVKRTFYEKKRIVEFITKTKQRIDIYDDKAVLNMKDANDLIRGCLLEGKPFMAGRLGNTELRNMLLYEKENRFFTGEKKWKERLCKNAGFFMSEKDDYQRFAELMRETCEKVDILGVWSNYMEEYITKKYCRNDVYYVRPQGLEPWYAPEYKTTPWSEALENKKVLFIYPFEETILQQNRIRDKIFPNTNILPQFQLYTLKAVQTISGNSDERFRSWFEALDFMIDKALKIPFDVAIIGCGAYGFPLAGKLKDFGKMVIHLGGATQLFWGIKGNRWENHPIISQYFNEYWTHPLPENIPKNYDKIEKGCYW